MSWHYKIGESQYLTEEEKTDNAIEVKNGLAEYGFTIESICGILGNMEAESDLNPGLKTGDAWGLTQFYPSSRITTFASEESGNWYDGTIQLKLINEEGYYTGSKVQWIPKYPYKPMTWDEFKHLTNVKTATGAYLYNNERPAVLNLTKRYQYATKWYKYFTGRPPVPPKKVIKGLPLYMMIRHPIPF